MYWHRMEINYKVTINYKTLKVIVIFFHGSQGIIFFIGLAASAESTMLASA